MGRGNGISSQGDRVERGSKGKPVLTGERGMMKDGGVSCGVYWGRKVIGF